MDVAGVGGEVNKTPALARRGGEATYNQRSGGKKAMPTEVSRHKIEVTLFPEQPMDKGLRKTICEYHEYIEHVVGEYVMECAASCKDRRNLSVRIGANGAWRDFSICDHHAEVIEGRMCEEAAVTVDCQNPDEPADERGFED